MALVLVAIHPEDTLYGTRRMKMAAAPIPLRGEEEDGSTVSRQSDVRKLSVFRLV